VILTAWRITKRKHARTAFSGEGARQFGGRWNHPGVPMVYAAETRSLAALEILVHVGSAELLEKYVLFEVGIDEALVTRLEADKLPKNWRADPPPEKLRTLGDEWALSANSAVLQVPSALVAGEKNFLLNPRHPDFSRLRLGRPQPFDFDPRLVAQ
jgi:RES domain-containing protein